VLGIVGPQGAGKSTLARALVLAFEAAGRRAATLSLDDLYLPLATRERLRREDPELHRFRGPPGSHDVDLGAALLDGLHAGRALVLPRFDKAAADGRGARREEGESVGVLDVLVFEGWFLGAQPGDGTPADPVQARAEAALATYASLFEGIDRLVALVPPSPRGEPALAGGGGGPAEAGRRRQVAGGDRRLRPALPAGAGRRARARAARRAGRRARAPRGAPRGAPRRRPRPRGEAALSRSPGEASRRDAPAAQAGASERLPPEGLGPGRRAGQHARATGRGVSSKDTPRGGRSRAACQPARPSPGTSIPRPPSRRRPSACPRRPGPRRRQPPSGPAPRGSAGDAR
jgi:energy-coupling factor transporter ATP-binding protein EcfA2